MQMVKIEGDGVQFEVPPHACDCHMHIFGSPEQYPPAESRSYTPVEAPLSAWQELGRTIGMQRAVIVQPSAYGVNNNCLSDMLRQLGSSGRGIAAIDHTTTDDELERLDGIGVVGVRINPKSIGSRDAESLRDLIARTASRIAPLGWHVQLHAQLQLVQELSSTLRRLPTPFVLDHMGGAEAPVNETTLAPLLALLEDGRCWIKLSGAYRVSRLSEGFEDATPIARMLVECNPDRLVWGSDWPHTSSHSSQTSSRPPDISFRKLDPMHLLRLLADAAGNQTNFVRILRENPQELYRFPKL